jgi:hypothetical protein
MLAAAGTTQALPAAPATGGGGGGGGVGLEGEGLGFAPDSPAGTSADISEQFRTWWHNETVQNRFFPYK